MIYRSESFDPDRHDVEHFRCGEASLDDWLREQARPAAVRRTARTWVWTDAQDTVVGYYALSAHKVSREQVPSKIGRGGPAEIPAVLIGRLALAEALRGQRLGPVLLADALSRVVEATRTVAAPLVVVEALHEQAAAFYARLGCTRLPGTLRWYRNWPTSRRLCNRRRDRERFVQPRARRWGSGPRRRPGC